MFENYSYTWDKFCELQLTMDVVRIIYVCVCACCDINRAKPDDAAFVKKAAQIAYVTKSRNGGTIL